MRLTLCSSLETADRETEGQAGIAQAPAVECV